MVDLTIIRLYVIYMKRGFTLVELLAVIVILAIIIAIAVPGISNLINAATRESFKSNAKLVIKALDYKMMNDSSFDVTSVDETNMNSLLNLSSDNYDDVTVTKISDQINIVITGKNKWAGLVTYGTYTDLKTEDLPIGLVGYWKFDGNANDSSDNGNNCTVSGAALTTDNKGKANSAYYFDGIDDYIQNTMSINVKTVSLWIKVNTLPTSNQIVFAYLPSYAGLGFFNGDSFILSAGKSVRRSSLNNFTAGTWNHIAIVYGSSTVSVYINSIEPSYLSGDNTWTESSNSFNIGRRSTGTYFNGSIDDIRMYNRELTSDEIKLLYNIKK